MVLACALVSACALVASCASVPVDDGVERHVLTRQNAFLYEVSSPGAGGVRLYLLGSLHALTKPLALGPDVADALDRADALVLELDVRNLSVEEAGELMLRYGVLMPGEDLSAALGPETLALLHARLAEPDFTPAERAMALRLRPWAIAALLAEKQLTQVDASTAYGVDLYFAEASDGLEVLELETADEQIYTMSSLSDAQAEEMLREDLAAENRGGFTVIQDAWMSGSESALTEVIFGGQRPGEDEFFDVLFFARNERMAASLQEYLEENEDAVYFAVIGAGHVVGEGSVPELLRNAGYRVERAR